MRIYAQVALFAVSCAGLPMSEQTTPRTESTSERSPAEMAAELRVQATSIATAELSPIFTAFADEKTRVRLRTSADQIAATRQ